MEEKKDRRSTTLYAVIAAVVTVAAIVLVVWNSGLLQRSLTALNVNGTKYSAADMQYYYRNIYSSYAQSYMLDSSVSPKKQVYDQETGQSWHDRLLELAEETLTNNTALARQARDEGFELTDESRSQLSNFTAQLNTAWVTSYTSRSALIKANFGPYMTYDRLLELVNQELLASDYASARLEAAEHPDADYQAYYKEHADELDTVTYTQFTFQASLPSTDADGNPIERTGEEEAAQMEAAKAEQKALAEKVKTRLDGGADPEELAEEYKDKLYTFAVSDSAVGSTLTAYYAYGGWLTDSTRRFGEVSLSERDYGTSCNYYVVVYEGRELSQEDASDVRHLLVKAGDGSGVPTQAEYDEAEQKAKSLLDEWKAGEATEDSFAALVSANTDDTASRSTGGLYSNVTAGSNYEQGFLDWAVDPARKAGDTGLVKTSYGWHIMYYVSSNDPIWRQTAASALREQDYEALTAQAAQGWSVSRGMGISFVKA